MTEPLQERTDKLAENLALVASIAVTVFLVSLVVVAAFLAYGVAMWVLEAAK